MTYIDIFTVGIALVALGLSLVAYGLWGIKAKRGAADDAALSVPAVETGVDPSTETDEYKAIVRENSILRRPDPEENAYSPKGKFLIENVPNDIQSYTVWRMADVLLLGGRKPRGFCFRTRAEADEFCRRKEGGE